MTYAFQTTIDALEKTAPLTKSRLKKAGVTTIGDLLRICPHRYEDYTHTFAPMQTPVGSKITHEGTITALHQRILKSGKKMQTATIENECGTLTAVWFNQPFIISLLRTHSRISCSGTFAIYGTEKIIEVQEYEARSDTHSPYVHTSRLLPYYPKTGGVSPKTLREKITVVMTQLDNSTIPELLPDSIRAQFGLIPVTDALRGLHLPRDVNEYAQARSTLGFYELFELMLHTELVKKEWRQTHAAKNIDLKDTHTTKLNEFISSLPFTLTGAQQKVVQEILADFAKPYAMNRFIQGDVGSGKTAVAAIAAFAVHLCGYRTLYMAPTEILAQQHARTFESLLRPNGIHTVLLTANHVPTEKEFDDSTVIVGTQALLTKKRLFDNVGLVIIDEQHRFGVKQRGILKQKGVSAHLLTMTATPIPRTISLVLMGELDVSVIDELPKGRKPIKSYLVPPAKRDDAYKWIAKEMHTYHTQTYIVCPLIESSDTETMSSVKAATEEFTHLSTHIFPDFKVGLMHGKMKPEEKEKVMKQFSEKKLDILVSTSVIEVGVDVPNTTIILIEGAERFGLAQLHQLRGRVGRGTVQSYCLLFTSDTTSSEHSRLAYFCKTSKGMELAEYDLKIRGPGEMYGTAQHGDSGLHLADISNFSHVARVHQAVVESVSKGLYKDPDKAVGIWNIQKPSDIAKD